MDDPDQLNFKTRLQCLITYQDVLARNYLLAERTCDQEFQRFCTFHQDLRRKYLDLRTYAEQVDRALEEAKTESARKEKKIQSQSAQILRLTQHNKRNQERLAEFQRYLSQSNDNDRSAGQIHLDHLRDLLRDSVMSESEATTDLSDKNCTGDELEAENPHLLQNMPKVVSQSNGIGTLKRSFKDDASSQSRSMGKIIGKSNVTSPYSNIDVDASSVKPSRPSLSADKRPKQKIRKPSKEFLSHKSEESELSTDDIFWSKPAEETPVPSLYPVLPKVTSPPSEQKTLTPSTPLTQMLNNGSPMASTHLGHFRAKTHHFLSRNILIPETCCVCLKRINFGKLAYRCQTCNALCHTACKETCATLCLPNVKTPNRGAVSKFASRDENQLQVPALLVHCVKEIEQRGFQEVGIYRLNVVESQVKELKERILKSRTGLFDLSHYQDIHLICGVVKDFLRSLAESLLTNALWKAFAMAIDEECESIKQEKIDNLLQQLPKPNRDTLSFLILHLQRVASAPLCRMPILNLSRTMGPAIIGYSSKHVSGVDIVGETYKQTKLLEYFLKLPADYWTRFLFENADVPHASTGKIHPGTPILLRAQAYPQTPSGPPSNTFFSPI